MLIRRCSVTYVTSYVIEERDATTSNRTEHRAIRVLRHGSPIYPGFLLVLVISNTLPEKMWT